MRRSWTVAVLVLLAGAAVAEAQKPTKEFRKAFQEVFTPAKLGRDFGSYAVILKDGIPAVSRYGEVRSPSDLQGFQTIHVDVVDGQLVYDGRAVKSPLGVLLWRGEVVGIPYIGYGDGRVDVNFEALQTRSVQRSDVSHGGASQTRREAFTTVLRFALPASLPRPAGPSEVTAVLELVGVYLKPFRDEASARQFAASLGRRPPEP
jgi:hypothetical protein